MKSLSDRIAGISPVKLALMVRQLRSEGDGVELLNAEPIAVIGIGCRFPGGATDPESYWKLLRDGVDAITEAPRDRWNADDTYDRDPEVPGKMYVRHGGFVNAIDQFDAGFFRISRREAVSMDPQQRMLLEVAWEALENAAQVPANLSGTQTGVFVGISTNDYVQEAIKSGDLSRVDGYLVTGSALNAAAGRVSYVLGLQGPCMAVDTACSSSLTAIHLACQSLHSQESNLALACGVNAILSPLGAIALCKARMLAPDGRCKTFDASADGYVRGEGCGVAVLKRLSDALRDGDPIYAVIRGSAVNQDGPSGGLTVPNGPAQEAVIQRALASAGVQPAQVGYIEAHGTGTPLGDPIEVRALARVLGEGRSEPLRIGSVKTNIGHLESAAGMAGFIKLVLSLQRGEIPPHLHLKELNPHIAAGAFPIEIPTVLTPWMGRRIGGVSSFGASGTNAHVVVESAPARTSVPEAEARHPLCLSAKTPAALAEAATRLDQFIAAHDSLSLDDLCFTLATGRTVFAQSVAIPVSSLAEARRQLAALARGESLAPHVDGAEIDLYRRQARGRKVALPAYPFQRERYWIERSSVAPESSHPLLGRRLDSALRDTIFETRFSVESPAFLKDHLVYGVVIVPGACHVSLMLSAAEQVFGTGPGFLLEGITFFEPLVLPEGQTFSVQTVLTPDSATSGSLQIYSRPAGAPSWTLHATANVKAESADTPDLGKLQASLADSLPGSDFYEKVQEVSFQFGPTFQWIETLHRSGEEVVAELRQPAAVTDAATCLLHPGLIDSCFQTFSVAQASAAVDATAYAPIGIGSFRSYSRPGTKLWCRAARAAGRVSNAETFTGSFQLRDDSGRLVAEAIDLQVKRAPRAALLRAAKKAMSDWFYAIDWQPAPTPAVAGPLDGPWLMVARPGSAGSELAAALLAHAAEGGCIAPGQALPSSAKPWRGVVDLSSLDEQIPDAACRSALALLQSVIRSPQRPLPRVWMVTRGAQPAAGLQSADGAAHAAVWGLARTAALEHPELHCAVLDLCPGTDPVASLISELVSDSLDDQVAWRNGVRYVARLARRAVPARTQPMRADASYLITGGLGDLGLLVAHRLVESGARHIALLGRSAPSAAARRTLEGIEAQVTVLQADVSDLAATRRALSQIAPPLAGIVHAAGAIDDGVLLEQTGDRLSAVLAAKVSGAWNLHALTESLPLDFFVLFSSASSVLGSPGQSNYAAANAALDALAAYRRGRGLPGLSINWGPWSGTGMAARSGASRLWTAFGMDSFTAQQALDAFEAALGSSEPQLAILRMNWSKLLARLPGGHVPPLLAGIAAGVEARGFAKSRSAAEQAILEQYDKANPAARAALIRDYVRIATSRILGLEPSHAIDVRLPFNELGFDSLLALELRDTLQSGLNVSLAAASIFEHPAIDALATFIARDLLALPVEKRLDEPGPAAALIDLNAEAVLDLSIRPAAMAASGPPSAILLTGATGFLGAYYLRELLNRTDADIYCLVRARSVAEGQRRLEEKLSTGNRRVIAVPGDLTQPNLGLDPARYHELGSRIDSIFHSGAVVNFMHSYQSLKPATVFGTQEVLRFAGHLRTKRLHHISTVAVFTNPHYRKAAVLLEDDPVEHWEGLMVGYAQSKWVAEKMVRIARSREMPVAIYRPGMITGDSRSGECKLDDFMPRMIRGCIQLGAAPDMGGFVMDLVPVDYCARATVELSLRAESMSKAFNLLNPPAIPWNHIVERIREFGYPIAMLGYRQWLDVLRQAPADNALIYLLPVLEGLSDELFTWPRADCRNTLEGLAGTDVICPPAAELLETYLSYFVLVGYLMPPGEKIGAPIR
jgi:thioester reductase-like protein